MLPVAVTSRFHVATAIGDVATTLDEERVLPPQLQKPDNYRAFFVSIAGPFTCSRSQFFLHFILKASQRAERESCLRNSEAR